MQIKSSLEVVGLVEPVVIFIDSVQNHMKILDGHLRVEALKDLGENKVKCIISSVYDTFTLIAEINRINIIQEQRMIKEALNSGIPIEKLTWH
ncbi:MAG: ParB N-terminal domain-containing protein [Enterobacter sp.]